MPAVHQRYFSHFWDEPVSGRVVPVTAAAGSSGLVEVLVRGCVGVLLGLAY